MARTHFRTTVVAVVAVLLAVAAGCARPGSEASGPEHAYGAGGDIASDSPAMWIGGEDCESFGDPSPTPPVMTPLPAGAVLVSVARCLYETRVTPGDGEWMFRIEQQATSGLDALATALRLPSEPAGANQFCTLIGYPSIILTVTDSLGRQSHPEIPRTACGAPLAAVTDAITALSWTTASTTKTNQQSRTELEVSSGCSNGWKPMIPIVAAEGSGTQTVTLDTSARALKVCRYDLDSDPANGITMGNGATYHLGTLVSASTLDAAAGRELLNAVAAAPRTVGPCAQGEAPFAIVYPADGGGPFIAIELAGCHRALVDAENYLRQLDPTLVNRLVG